MSEIASQRAALSVAQGDPLTEYEQKLMERLFANPRLWPASTKEYILDYFANNLPSIPITQLFGFQRYVANKGSTFPAGPVDGQPFVLVVDAANGINWTLRYDSGITDAYKWTFENAPLYATITPGESTTSTGYTDLATAGPSVTVPKAGLYEIQFGACIDNSTADSDTKCAVLYGGSSPLDAEGIEMEGIVTGGSGNRVAQSRTFVATIAADNQLVKVQYRVTSGTGTYRNRWLFVRPIRISA